MNPFQTQFPLSPRKFWKKFLPTIIPAFILTLVGGFALWMILADASVSNYGSLGLVTLDSIVGALILFVVILALYAWYFKAYIRSYTYEGGDNFVTIKKGVFAPREIHVQYQKIQDVYVDQDILDRIMGLYDVHLASATISSGMEAHIDGVDAQTAEGLKNFLLGKIQSGGSVPLTQPNGPVAAAMPAPVAAPAQFTQEISSTTFPFKGGLVFSQAIGIFFLSVFISLFVTFTFIPKSGTTFSFADYVPGGYFGIFVLIAVLYFIFHFVGILIWDKNYRFQFTPEYILYHTGIISQSETHLPYRSIQDVNVSQSIIERMMGLATVRIENAAQIQVGKRTMTGGVRLIGQNPQTANQIAEVVKNIILTKNSSQTGL